MRKPTPTEDYGERRFVGLDRYKPFVFLLPVNDGAVIRLSFPQLTEERRKAMVKVAHAKAEDGRVAIRNLRRSARKDLEAFEKEGEISSDELDRAEKDLERITHDYVADVDGGISARWARQ